MKIDFEKLILLLLPIRVRKSLKYVVAASASVFQKMYAEYQAWETDMRLQAAITCQVMYLELILNYRLLGTFTRTIYITDGDGLTVDFIVNVPAGVQVDANRMVGLLNKYKTHGKRYTIGQSDYTYEINWTDAVCEKATLAYEAAWSGLVCEQVEGAPSVSKNLISVDCYDAYIVVTAEFPVASDLFIVVATDQNTYHLYINVGQTVGRMDVSGVAVSNVHIHSINPASDATYEYVKI